MSAMDVYMIMQLDDIKHMIGVGAMFCFFYTVIGGVANLIGIGEKIPELVSLTRHAYKAGILSAALVIGNSFIPSTQTATAMIEATKQKIEAIQGE